MTKKRLSDRFIEHYMAEYNHLKKNMPPENWLTYTLRGAGTVLASLKDFEEELPLTAHERIVVFLKGCILNDVRTCYDRYDLRESYFEHLLLNVKLIIDATEDNVKFKGNLFDHIQKMDDATEESMMIAEGAANEIGALSYIKEKADLFKF